MEKKCSRCSEVKNASEFHRRTTAKDGLQRHCKVCEKLAHHSHYLKNSEVFKERAKTRRVSETIAYRTWKETLCCSICSEADSYCLDFHHLDPTQKDFSISDAVSFGLHSDKMTEELKKCIVVCKNCHTKIHRYGLDNYLMTIEPVG